MILKAMNVQHNQGQHFLFEPTIDVSKNVEFREKYLWLESFNILCILD